jgi:hypothetical protein
MDRIVICILVVIVAFYATTLFLFLGTRLDSHGKRIKELEKMVYRKSTNDKQ